MAAAAGSLTVLVLAAGKGTRLRSRTIKLLHPVAGRPMVAWVLAAARGLRPARTVTVIGYQGDDVRAALTDDDTRFVVQAEQRGTGHAVLEASSALRGAGTVLILNGDLPTLRTETLRAFVRHHRRTGAALSVLSAEVPDARGYGRIVRGEDGSIRRIVEERDASAAERRIREINSGIYCADPKLLLRVLSTVRPDNAQGEYYITDAVGALLGQGRRVGVLCHDDHVEVLGVNTRQELSEAARRLYARKADALQDAGVTLVDADRTLIDPRASIGRDTVIWPDVVIEGASRLGEGCVLRPGCRIADSRLGKGVEVLDHCVVTDSSVGDGARLGPFAHLRPDTRLAAETRVGNFVELKKTRLGRGSKANHLAYLGDAEIGARCNIGAGTITCNYDGTHKHRTTLGDEVFIGSDSQLVAPVRVRKGAYVAAGSTVTSDVPAGALAVGRARQRNIDGWVKRRKKRKPGRGD